jgi:hypothetical protein
MLLLFCRYLCGQNVLFSLNTKNYFTYVILGTKATATTGLTKHVFNNNKSQTTLLTKHSKYIHKPQKKYFFKKSLFSNRNHNNYNKNKHTLLTHLKLVSARYKFLKLS